MLLFTNSHVISNLYNILSSVKREKIFSSVNAALLLTM